MQNYVAKMVVIILEMAHKVHKVRKVQRDLLMDPRVILVKKVLLAHKV
jgi:hypothetical protein